MLSQTTIFPLFSLDPAGCISMHKTSLYMQYIDQHSRFLLVSSLCCAKRNVESILQKYFQKSILKILFYFVFWKYFCKVFYFVIFKILFCTILFSILKILLKSILPITGAHRKTRYQGKKEVSFEPSECWFIPFFHRTAWVASTWLLTQISPNTNFSIMIKLPVKSTGK